MKDYNKKNRRKYIKHVTGRSSFIEDLFTFILLVITIVVWSLLINFI